MKVGFDGMQTAHIIDEVIFDLSFVSTGIADDHESKVSAWITQQILPAVDSVLNEFDQAKTVLRLDLVEVDLGDVTEDAFQMVLMQRLREKLGGMLLGVRDRSTPSNFDVVAPSRVSYAQIDLEQLRFFLLSGKMPGRVSTSSQQVHEQILARVLQESSDAFIQFLKQSTAKRTLIDRLVKQFTEPYLVTLLQKTMPTHALVLLNLLDVYRATINEKNFPSVTNAASIDSIWASIFDVMLEKVGTTESSVTVVNAIVEKRMFFSSPDSADIIKKMQRVATRLKLEKKIDSALPKILNDVRVRRHEAVRPRDGRKIDEPLRKYKKSDRTTQYQRIIKALKAAKIAAFRSSLKGLRKNPIRIRERLAIQGKQAVMREQLVEKLADDILLDITDIFMPAATGYLKQLLAQSSRLHHGVGEAVWKKRLWKSNLSYLFAEPNDAFIPVSYIKSLASLMSPTHDAESVLRIWHAELSTTSMQSNEQSLSNLLRQLVADEGLLLPQGVNSYLSDSDVFKTLVQRLQPNAPQDTRPLQAVIAELAQEQPEQLQRIYDAIRGGTLSTASLKVADQHQLLMVFIDHSSEFNAENRAAFVQAIASHAEHAVDQSTFYRLILQALLQHQPVDLEAIQKRNAHGENDAAVQRIKAKAAVRVKQVATVDRTTQYQRIVQALEETEIVGFYPLPEGLQQHPVMIRQLLAEHGKQATTRQQLAVKLTDKTLVDITSLYIPAAVSYIEQLLAHAGVLHQGEGEAAWKKRLWESNLSYLFTEANAAFIPADYLKTLARLMSPTHDAESVLRIWHTELSTTSMQLNEQSLSNLLRQLVADEGLLLPQGVNSYLSDSDVFKTLVQRLQPNASQDTHPLQAVIAELAQEHPEQLQRIYAAIRGGALSTASLKVADQHQLLMVFIDHASEFNAENRAAFIQAIASHAEHAVDQSTYYRLILQALLQHQPVDLEAIQKRNAHGENDAAVQRIKAKAAVRVKQVATVDRTTQYQRIVQALEETEIAGFYPLPEGLQQHPVMIRQLLAEHGKQATTRQQLAVKLTDKTLVDITSLYIPAAVSHIEQLLAHAGVLHQGEGEAAWKKRLWESNLSYLFTEANAAFIPADYLKTLARLMSPTHDAESVLRIWHTELSTTSMQSNEQSLSNLLRQLVADEGLLLPQGVNSYLSDSDVFKTLVQRLQPNAPQDTRPLQAVIAELAQEHPEQLQRIYDAIRGGTLSTARLNAADQHQLLTVFIDHASEFNAENRAAFIQAIASHAEHAVDQSTYYRLILQALLHDQPVDLVLLSKQSDVQESLLARGDELAASDVDAGAETIDRQPLFDAYDRSASVLDIETKEMIEISNAGQIIAAPYLTRLFQMLKLLDDEGSFVNFEAAERAVHLLQFMVDEQSDVPEYLLVLNKILCGIPTAAPIRRQLRLSDNEKAVVEDLIKGMIQNWRAIGNTSVSGFRETFLQRDGGLVLEDDAWHLTVYPGTFDMLLDGLPWSFSIVKHAWMSKAIHVDWR